MESGSSMLEVGFVGLGEVAVRFGLEILSRTGGVSCGRYNTT